MNIAHLHSLEIAGHAKKTIVEMGVEEIILKKLEKHEQLSNIVNSCKSLSSILPIHNHPPEFFIFYFLKKGIPY